MMIMNVNLRATRWFSLSTRLLIPTYKVAMVGSGPAGFYTAYHILNKSPKEQFGVEVDIFERLPSPYGLSRYGVAPDHPEVKNCEDYLKGIMKLDHKVRFFGNVNIGKDISLKELADNYHSVVLSYGCVNEDNKLNIPGADLKGVISARHFVNWYNGHPDFYSSKNSFKPPSLDQIENVTIIGNGNVALDVARILLADPVDHWSPTDISSDALQVLKSSKVSHVNIVARRGLLESAFTNKELRELLELNNTKKVKFIPIDDEVYSSIEPHLTKLDRTNKRRLALLEKHSKTNTDYEPSKTWTLQYLKNPKQFVQNEQNPDLLSKVIFTKNKVVPMDPEYKIVPDENADTFEIKTDLAILSIGYKGSSLAGFEDNEISLDQRQNRLVNKGGRIILSTTKDFINPIYKSGFYTSGWIKNGPKGVIASTMMDSFDTGENIIQDLKSGIHTQPSSQDLDKKLETLNYVSWPNWLKLDKYELQRGAELGKTREKVCNPDQMIQVACK